MRDRFFKCGVLLVLGTLGTLCSLVAAGSGVSQPDFALRERGRYLTIAADCAACHDDPYEDQPFAGGRPIETPFGTVTAPNITPDRDTGIGAWSDAQFEGVMRHGILPNGQRVYPAMPFPYYTRMSSEDVRAIRAFLSTVPPVHHAVVANQLPFPFNVRTSMLVWDLLYFRDGEFKPDDSRSPEWNRGAYLVEGPGHCAACHTPKTVLGGDKDAQALQGYSIQGWFAPDLGNDTHRGLAEWTNQDIVSYLESGHNRFAAASGPMSEEVVNSSSHMTSADLEAIAVYLKSQPGTQESPAAVPANDPVMTAGAAIYSDLCSACHAPEGTGVPDLIPDLAASGSVASKEPTSLIRVVLEGANSAATDKEPTGPAMPAYGWQLNDAQVAAVTTYVRNSWTHAASPVTEAEVAKARAQIDVAAQKKNYE